MTSDKCDLKIHGTATIGKKWQIVIPKAIRDLLDLHEGDWLVIMTKNDIAIWLIKNDDMPAMMEYMQQEMDK